MGFEHIETLKRQYTDQFVVVDDHRPELARFRGVTGQVKTINMNGRALVEFQDYIANIGWYDIELDFLTVVPKPDPEAAKAAAKPAAKPAAAKAAPTEPAAKAKPAAKSAAATPAPPKAVPGTKPAAGKMSTAEILAASRAKKAAEAAASAPETTASVARRTGTGRRAGKAGCKTGRRRWPDRKTNHHRRKDRSLPPHRREIVNTNPKR